MMGIRVTDASDFIACMTTGAAKNEEPGDISSKTIVEGIWQACLGFRKHKIKDLQESNATGLYEKCGCFSRAHAHILHQIQHLCIARVGIRYVYATGIKTDGH